MDGETLRFYCCGPTVYGPAHIGNFRTFAVQDTFRIDVAGLPPESYAEAMTKSSVTPVALGTGYMVFFLYSTVIGVFAIILTFVIAARQAQDAREPVADSKDASA